MDETGAYEDWVEIYYNIPSSMSLGGYYLTDNLDNPTKWMFPDIQISGEGFLLIWTDDDEEDGNLHTNFKLSNSGEEIGLFDTNVNLIDQISFGAQTEDVSYGREIDGSYSWSFFENPSPGYSNTGENPCQPGDVNCDSELDILDAVSIVNLIMNDEYDIVADLNFDGIVNILDIIQLVNIILR